MEICADLIDILKSAQIFESQAIDCSYVCQVTGLSSYQSTSGKLKKYFINDIASAREWPALFQSQYTYTFL